MYHRTLDGTGIVCGLPISCESDCSGWIRIGRGFAIDDCGRDLVVCDALRYDLIGELKNRGWILEGSGWNPCKPDAEQPDCPDTECFYILLQYREKPDNYTTPLRGACQEGPGACEPTRIHESVCVELARKKPKLDGNGLDDIADQVESVFDDLSKSMFGQKIDDKKSELAGILSDDGNIPENPCELFCQLQYLFLRYLKDHPALLECHLADRIAGLKCLPFNSDDTQPTRDVFCELFRLIWTYIMDVLTTAMMPACPMATPGCGVVLGTAEVRGGKLVRLCLTPREYVWTFRSVLPLLYQWILNEALYEREGNAGRCCPEYKFDCHDLGRVFLAEQTDKREWVAAAPRAARKMASTFAKTFDFTRPGWVPAGALEYTTAPKLDAIVRAYQLVRTEEQPEVDPSDLLSNLQRPSVLRAGSAIHVTEIKDRVSGAPVAAPKPEYVRDLEARLQSSQQELMRAHTRLDELDRVIAEIRGHQ
jgi:hypothetical protein